MSPNAAGFIVASHEGPTWDMEVGRPATFKVLSNQTGGTMAAFEEIVPPLMGTPLHIHRTSDELIFIVSGQFSISVGRENPERFDRCLDLHFYGISTWVAKLRHRGWPNEAAAGRASDDTRAA